MKDAFAFRRSLTNVPKSQENLLMSLIRRNSGTDFGRRWGFSDICGVQDFKDRVPISTYQDYEADVRKIMAGRKNVLTADPVLLLEPTSGSTTHSKLIPYTPALKAEFQRAIAPWVIDVFGHDPAIMLGQSYWSISPVARQYASYYSDVRIGFDDDSEYLGAVQSKLARSVMAVPSEVRHIEDISAFRYVTLLFLLKSRSLSFISVWHPTFLTLLFQHISTWWQRLADDIEYGSITPPAPVPDNLKPRLRRLVRPDPGRAKEIRAAFQNRGTQGEINSPLWPRLRQISCWADANSASYLPEVTQLFPDARVQGKGLIATEGIVSIPLLGYEGTVLATRSHFFEFLPVPGIQVELEQAHTLLAHELEAGEQYSIVMTTGGGLYRYHLEDVIEVVGFTGDCPLIRFVGKLSNISDHFGEKLNERHVQRALDDLLAPRDVMPDFVMVAFENKEDVPAYTLFVEAKGTSDEVLRILGSELDEALEANFNYQYCRDLGQLAPLRVFRIHGVALDRYVQVCAANGRRLGDVKPVALHSDSGWSRRFSGHYI